MSFRNFRIQVIIRILLLTVFLTGLVYFLIVEKDYIKSFFLLAFTLLTTINLFYLNDKTNNDISGFLTAILSDDFTNKYSDKKKGSSFWGMFKSFNVINEKLNGLSLSHESQYLYMKTLVEQVQTGIISFDDSQKIGLINEAMKSLLGTQNLVNLSGVKLINEKLYDSIVNLKGNQSLLLKTSLNNQIRQLSIKASEFYLRDKYFKLISIQDIRNELDRNEMDAWQKLIKVLTHEIMNSIAPITSLSDSLHQIVLSKQESIKDKELTAHLVSGLEAIKSRSGGLMKFTQDYRSLTKVPLPTIKEINIHDFFNEIASLFKTTLAGSNIRFNLKNAEEDAHALMDPNLMSQVFINLLKNAKEAIEMNDIMAGEILMDIQLHERLIVHIKDNGGGISDELMEQIFIPFFTNKPLGSGIGLSLAKQIIQLHEGNISVSSKKDITEVVVTV